MLLLDLSQEELILQVFMSCLLHYILEVAGFITAPTDFLPLVPRCKYMTTPYTSGLMSVWFLQWEVTTFENTRCETAICKWHARTFKGPSWFFVIGLGFLPPLSILTVEQTNWSCRYHGPGVQPWWIVILWPFLDFPAKVFPKFSVISAETCLMSDHPNLSDHPNRGICGPLYCPSPPPPPLSNLPSLTSRNNVARLYTHRSKERAFLGHS